MVKVILKFAGGLLLGLVIYSLMSAEQIVTGGQWIFCIIWGIGIVGGFREYLTWLSAALNTSLKVGFLAWISFGSGVIGFILLMLVLTFVLMFGWIYGWIVLVKELIAAF